MRPSTGARWFRSFKHFMRTKPLGATGVVILFIALVIGLVGPYLTIHDPLKASPDTILLSPNAEFPFGTDIIGRDILTRVIWGTRVSLYVGFSGAIVAAIFGSMLGVSSGYYGGRYDLIIQRFVDGLTAFPSLIMALALVAAFGSTINNVILALIIIFVPRFARVVRSVTLSIKEYPYVEAARAIGASNIRIMLRHVLPNTFASLIVVATASVGSMIIIEASLSFLGVGSNASQTVSWGLMLSGDTQAYFSAAPWIGIFPGVALSIVVFGINVIGDALRDVLDPRLRGR